MRSLGICRDELTGTGAMTYVYRVRECWYLHQSCEPYELQTQKDQKKLLNAARGDAIGPTTLYYAGVTAPVIGAGMAAFGRGGLEDIGLEMQKILLQRGGVWRGGGYWCLRLALHHRHS